jgi:hypothetical protein
MVRRARSDTLKFTQVAMVSTYEIQATSSGRSFLYWH